MRAISSIQVAVYVVLLVIGVAAGYAFGSASQPSRISTITLTQAQGVQSITIGFTETARITVTQAAPTLAGEIPIGALLPLTGSLSSFTPSNRAAVEMAIEDLNSYAKSLGLPITFRLFIEDTAADPTSALAKLQALYARGVKAVVGPQTSAEVRAIKSYADGNKIVVCSQSSISSDLALPDYIFRNVPPDRIEGKAIARLIIDYGVKHLYILYRNDAWGSALANATEAKYKELGGSVIGRAGFDPKKTDFSAELAAAELAVKDAVSRHGAGSVGVLLISFDEGGTIAAQASGYPDLMSVTWFGQEATANNLRILDIAGEQLARVKLLSVSLIPPESPKFEEFESRLRARTGENASYYNAAIYDCVWLIGLSVIEAGRYDGEAIRNALPLVARTYIGPSGWTLLDSNGDRTSGNYGVWAVVMKEGKPVWEKVAVVDTGSDTVTWIKKV